MRATGRALDLPPGHWLGGPSGERPRIGDAWLQREADRHGGRVGPAGGGLLPSMAALDRPRFTAAALHPAVREFYEDTAAWRINVWSQWTSVAWPGGWLVSALFARRLGQLSLPLRPMDVAHGMSSEVVPVVGADGEVVGTSWHRTLRSTGDTVYAGWYGAAALPDGLAVRVSFPLPDGRLVVLLRPENAACRIPVHERFHVHVDAEGVLQTDHDLRL